VNIAVAAGVGTISGHYIFKQPLEEYWQEQYRLQKEQEAVTGVNNNSGGGGDVGGAAPPAAGGVSKSD
jgi:hypothetical protein